MFHSTFPAKRPVLCSPNNPCICRSLRSAAHLISAHPPYLPSMCVYGGEREGKGGRKLHSPELLAGDWKDFSVSHKLWTLVSPKTGGEAAIKCLQNCMNQEGVDRAENLAGTFTNSTPKLFGYIPEAPLYLNTGYNCNNLPSKVQWTERTHNSHYFGIFFHFGSFSVVQLCKILLRVSI